jgi:hypothetical protein
MTFVGKREKLAALQMSRALGLSTAAIERAQRLIDPSPNTRAEFVDIGTAGEDEAAEFRAAPATRKDSR